MADDTRTRSQRRALAFNAVTDSTAMADLFVPLSVRRAIADAVLAALYGPEQAPQDANAVACPEGFHWIGQPFTHCDRCGLPAWDHAGNATKPRPTSPFDDEGPWALEPWGPGEAEACRRKWDPSYIPNGAE